MKYLIVFNLLFFLPLSGITANFSVTIVECYELNELNTASSSYPFCETFQADNNKRFIVLTIKGKSAERVNIDKKDCHLLAGSDSLNPIGSIDLKNGVFKNYFSGIRFKKDLEYFNMVFYVENKADCKSILIGSENIAINSIDNTSKIKRLQFNFTIVKKEIIESLSESSSITDDQDKKFNSNEILKAYHGKLLSLTVSGKATQYAEFNTFADFGNIFSGDFDLITGDKIKMHCFAGSSWDAENDFTPNMNVNVYKDRGGEGKIKLFFAIGNLSLDQLEGCTLFWRNTKVLTF